MPLQEIKDKYLFGIVAVLLVLDVIFMLPTTIVSSAILRREQREVSGDNVSNKMIHYMTVLVVYISGWRVASNNWNM